MHRTPRSASVAPRSLRIFVCLLLVAAFTPVFTATAVTPLPALPPSSTTYYVDVATGDDANTGGMNDPFKSITEATYNVMSGDTIIVAPGTYTSSETTSSGEYFPIWVMPGVTLKSSGGPNTTIVDAEYMERVFFVAPYPPDNQEVAAQTVPMPPPEFEGPVTIEGITITKGSFEGAGGGIKAVESDLTLKNVVVTENIALWGAGMFSIFSTVTVEASKFTANGYDPYAPDEPPFPLDEPAGDDPLDDARWWGALTLNGGGGFFWLSHVDIKSSEFTLNGTLRRGPGVTARNSYLGLTDTDFSLNVVTAEDEMDLKASADEGYMSAYGDLQTMQGMELLPHKGGAVNANHGSYLSMKDCSLKYNAAPWGGGIYLDNWSSAEILKSDFVGNYCIDGAAILYSDEFMGDRQEALEEDKLLEELEGISATDVEAQGVLEPMGMLVDQCVFEDQEGEGLSSTVFTSWDASATVQNSLFDNNMTSLTTVNFGFNYHLFDFAERSIETDFMAMPKTVMNCTFADNYSRNSVMAEAPEVAVVNTICWGNENEFELPPIGPPQETEVDFGAPWEYSVFGAEVWNSDLEYDFMHAVAADMWGNISEDPLFLMPEARDYRLSPPSPCTDTATSTAAPAYDLPGTFRPQDGDNDGEALWDMGAYEAIYSGTLRTGGATRYGTSVKAVQEYYDEADTIVLARGDLFADGLAASGLCGVYDAPLLLTLPGELPYQTKDEIVRLGASKAYIMGGTGAISDGVKTELEAMGLTVERIGGYDRYATAALIAEEIISEIGTPTATFIARGDLFADALTVSPVAYGIKSPILLVRTGDLPDATIDVLGDIDSDTVVIAGGSGAVSLNVEKGIESVTVAADRIDGADRYETSVAFSEYAVAQGWAKWMTTGLATGANFPDALTGGPAIGTDHGVLMLTPGETLHAGVETALTDNKAFISRLDIFGGNGAISDSVMAAAEDAIK